MHDVVEPLHCPVDRQSLAEDPSILNPSLQVKVAMLPTLELPTVTAPFAGAVSVVHWTAAITKTKRTLCDKKHVSVILGAFEEKRLQHKLHRKTCDSPKKENNQPVQLGSAPLQVPSELQTLCVEDDKLNPELHV